MLQELAHFNHHTQILELLMRPSFKVALISAAVILAVGCQKEDTVKVEKDPLAVDQVQNLSSSTFQSDEQRTAYAIGSSFGKFITDKIDQPKEMGILIDKDMVLKGIEDYFAGKQEIEVAEVQKIVSNFGTKLSKMAEEKAQNEVKLNGEAGSSYRSEYENQEGAHKTSTGLLYKVIKTGTGKSPNANDIVEVNYEGKQIDGTKFDSSYDRGKTSTFRLNQVIPGWTEGVQLMKEGGIYEFVIPPGLAYGKHGTDRIPAESTLVFKVELVRVSAVQ